MLLIWTSDLPSKVLKTLGAILKANPHIKYEICNNFSYLPDRPDLKAVLCLGAAPLNYLQAIGALPKNRTVSSLRNTSVSVEGLSAPVLVSYSVGIGAIDHGKEVDLLCDLNLALRVYETGTITPKCGDYKFVEYFTEALTAIRAQFKATGKPVEVALDLETVGFDPYLKPKGTHPGGYVVSIQMSYKAGKSDLIYFKDREALALRINSDLEFNVQMNELLTSDAISMRGANLKFDLNWLAVHTGLECTNFKFDTTLVGSLLDENRSNSLNTHAKVYTKIGGYDDCVTPDTLVATSDLRWVPIGDVKPGDTLVGFDEQASHKCRRRLRVAVAESTKRLKKEGLKITLSNGREIKCSSDHGFIAYHGDSNGPFGWMRAWQLKVGTRLQAALPVESPCSSWESGYMAGLYDGEGYVSNGNNPGVQSGISQKPGPVWDEYNRILAKYGIDGYSSSQKNSDGVMTSKHSGWPTLRLLQLFRPLRLLGKNAYEGKCIPSGGEKVYVAAIEKLGEIEVVSLQTSTHTFVAEGICSHNSFNAVVNKNRMDLLEPEVLLPYAGGDSDATLQVSVHQKAELLQDPQLANFYINILHPAARAMEQVEQGGICIDLNAYISLEQELNEEIDMLLEKAKKIVGGRIVAKHQDLSKRGGLNITKASLLNDFMFSPMGLNLKPKMHTAKSGAPSTALEHLMMFANVDGASEFVGLLSDFASATKTLSTYVVGFQKHIRSDGRYHPTYFLFAGDSGGTVTGRLSCRDPAFQCQVGATLVHSKEGKIRLDTIVSEWEQGKPFTVLTHTGEWKPVIGVYRNGIKPLLKITTASGAVLKCTGNHPWLTTSGFIKAEALAVGDTVWRLDESTDYIRGRQGRPLASAGGLRNLDGAPEVYSQVRLWDSERDTCSQPDWSEAEQVLWLLQESSINNAWSQSQESRVKDLLVMAAHESSVLQPEGQGVQELWREGDYCLPFLARFIRDLSSRYGGETTELVLREIGREWELRTSELQVGYSQRTVTESKGRLYGGDTNGAGASERVGCPIQSGTGHSWFTTAERVEPDSSPYHSYQAQKAGFAPDTIVSIEEEAEAETYDLTIEGSHSFVANGIVVHNTLPKHTKWAKKLRLCFPAPPGMLVMENDYSQGELRVIACIANEPTMIEAYRQGADLHVITPSKFVGYTVDEILAMETTDPAKFDAIRKMGKAGNFGLIYGMSAGGFQAYASTSYGVNLSDAEANGFRDGFFDTYPALPAYHKEYKAHAKLHGYVRSPLGRVRHLPLINSSMGEVRSGAERQAINSPVQSTLSDMMIWAIAEGKAKGYHKDAPCFGLVHDAGYRYIPEDNHEFYARREKEQMENLPFHKVGWNPQLTFVTDCKVGPNMASLKKLAL